MEIGTWVLVGTALLVLALLVLVIWLACKNYSLRTTNGKLVPPSSVFVSQLPQLGSASDLNAAVTYLAVDLIGPDGIPRSFNPTNEEIAPMYEAGIITQTVTDANIENVMTRFGINLYDGAVWGIAIAYGSSQPWQLALTEPLLQLLNVTNTTQLSEVVSPWGTILADGSSYAYGDNAVIYPASPIPPAVVPNYLDLTGPKPCFFRDIASNFYYIINPDHTVTISDHEHVVTLMVPGGFSWIDFRPILGENVWACMLYPLHVAFIKAGQNLASTATQLIGTIPAYSFARAFMLQVLPNVASKTAGGFYYSPVDTTDTVLSTSGENNASLHGALVCLNQVATAVGDAAAMTAVAGNVAQILKLLTNICFYSVNSAGTPILLFYQGTTNSGSGFVLNQSASNSTVSTQSANFGVDWVVPVDVQTWGLASYGPELLNSSSTLFTGYLGDRNLVSYWIWNSVKQTCGRFDATGNLEGFGYDNTNATVSANVVSGEWTFGAITAARMLLDYYTGLGATYAQYVTILSGDVNSMCLYVNKLTKQQGGAYLYADERAPTGYNWNANPIPSTASTAWAAFCILGMNVFRLDTVSTPLQPTAIPTAL